jgi:alanine racemase
LVARLWVDQTALATNYRRFLNQAGAVAAVVKADGYGCGIAGVAQALRAGGCTQFFVATASEGLVLRALLPDAVIFVFEGPLPATVESLCSAELMPVINAPAQLDLWRPHRSRPVALHVDTGMSRLGWEGPVSQSVFAGFEIACVMSHLACADTPDHGLNQLQRRRFDAVREQFPGVPASLCNSAGVLARLGRGDELARVGIGLYGGDPGPPSTLHLEPVVALEAEVLQLRRVEAGATVGYGADYRAPSTRHIAVLNLGYADGLARRLGPRLAFTVGGVRCPVVGRISMDLTCVDVTDTRVQAGDSAWLLDADFTINHLASIAETIPYEVLTAVGSRVQRRYCDSLPQG